MAEGGERAMEEGRERPRIKGMHSPLYIVAMNGDVEGLVSLHKRNSEILAELTPKRNSALHIAASYGCVHFVSKFIQLCHADNEEQRRILRSQNMEGNTALHEACSGGKSSVVDILLREDRELACIENLKGETPLFTAAENGHSSIVRKLLAATPDEGFKRRDGQTALHVAVRNSKIDVFGLLLAVKPDLANAVDTDGRSPLHIASYSDFSLLQKKSFGLPIGIRIILEASPSCYTADKNGQTPLHIAVKEGNSDLTEFILAIEPSCIEIPDRDGRSALHLAVEHATQIYRRSSRDLRRIMASLTVPTLINGLDSNGHTALAIAEKKGVEDPQLYTAIRGYLLRRGASPASQKIPEEASEDAPFEAKKHSHPTQNASSDEPIAVNISLIATVAFAVAFTLPGKVGDSRGNDILFHLLVISDTIAFCYSLGVALLLVYVRGNPDFSISAYIFAAISVAGASLAVTFGAAIHLAVGPRYPWLPGIVWFMVVIMTVTAINKSHAKLFLFGENWSNVLIVIVYPVKVFVLIIIAPPAKVIKEFFVSRFVAVLRLCFQLC